MNVTFISLFANSVMKDLLTAWLDIESLALTCSDLLLVKLL
jgi:hypothetical protein